MHQGFLDFDLLYSIRLFRGYPEYRDQIKIVYPGQHTEQGSLFRFGRKIDERGSMKMQANKDFDKVLMSFSSEVQGIAQEARALIYEILPQVVEVVWERQKTAGYGTGPKKMSEHFCWIAPYKKHVVLGFNYGSELPDPDHILEGTGKLFRHVKLGKIDDVRKSSIRNLIKAATKHRVPPPKGQ